MKQWYAILFCASLMGVVLPCVATAQITIDTTTQVRKEWKREGVRIGGGGGIGRKLQLQIAIEIAGTPFNGSNGRTILDFVITNTGSREISLPVSTNGTDVESAVSFRHAAVFVEYMSSDKHHGVVLQSGPDSKNPYVSLYGADSVPGTMKTLAPGESMRIRAEVALPNPTREEVSGRTLVARFMLDDETIVTRDGHRFLEAKEVGSASSVEYTPASLLFKSPD